jgi:hypothetical protein
VGTSSDISFLMRAQTTFMGLIAFDSLASYERYKARLKSDPENQKDVAMLQTKRIILREEGNFVEVVDGTFNLPSTGGKG